MASGLGVPGLPRNRIPGTSYAVSGLLIVFICGGSERAVPQIYSSPICICRRA